jgi:hypothetical protein
MKCLMLKPQLIQERTAKKLDEKPVKQRELQLQLTSTTRSCDPIINGFGANSLQ